MSGTVIPFRPPYPRERRSQPIALTRRWFGEHGALVKAALDLGSQPDVVFAARCRAMADKGGPGALIQLADQVAWLARTLADVATTLGTTAERIRRANSLAAG